MSEAPKRIWVAADLTAWCHDPMGIRDTDIEYRRADLPATAEQAFANEKVKALVETLKFYVYDDNWQNVVYEEEGGLGPSPINQDHGCKARAALAAMELHNPTQEGTDK